MIHFTCPACNTVLAAPGAGVKVRCPNCKQPLRVPSPSPPPPKTMLGQILPSPSNAIAAEPKQESLDELVEVRPRRYQKTQRQRLCPFCAEQISPDAMKCKHCGELVDNAMRKEKAIREADALADNQSDGVGIVAIVCAAFALIATIAGFFCFGYGTLVGIPVALCGLLISVFATKHQVTAFVLNALALVPPIVLTLALVGLMSMCCVGGARVAPTTGQNYRSPDPQKKTDPGPQKKGDADKKQLPPSPALVVIFKHGPQESVGVLVKEGSEIPPGWVGGDHAVSVENLGRENQIRAVLAGREEGATVTLKRPGR